MKQSYVYFLLNPATGLVKIGESKEPLRRKRQHEDTHGGKMVLLGIRDGGQGMEERLHRRFKEHSAGGVRNPKGKIEIEWLHPAPEVLAYAKGCRMIPR